MFRLFSFIEYDKRGIDMTYVKKLEGKKCFLSPVDKHYADEVVVWSNDLNIALKTHDAQDFINHEKQTSYLELMTQGLNHAYMIVEKHTEKPIGLCRLMHVDGIHKTATLGIFIGNKDFLGKGIGEDALRLLIDYAFNFLNIHNIWLYVAEYNLRACNLYKRLGFKEIGRRRQSLYVGGKYYDEIYMDLLSSEFEGTLLKWCGIL